MVTQRDALVREARGDQRPSHTGAIRLQGGNVPRGDFQIEPVIQLEAQIVVRQDGYPASVGLIGFASDQALPFQHVDMAERRRLRNTACLAQAGDVQLLPLAGGQV